MNLPNKITVFRFCCIPFLMAFSLIDFKYHWVAALLVYFVACMSDKADGIIARKRGLVTDFGKVMDPLSDKTLVFAAYLVFINMGWHTELCILLMLPAANGEVIAANGFGKCKTFLQMSTTGMTFLLLAIGEGSADITMTTPWLNIYCAIAFWTVTVVAVLSGIIYTKDGWYLIKTK